MWMSLFAVIAGAALFMYEFPKLKKSKQKKEIVVFITFLCFGVIFNILRFIEIDIPSPLDAVVFLFHPIVKTIYHVLS